MVDEVNTAEMVKRDGASSSAALAVTSDTTLDRIVALAADIFDAPMGLIALTGGDRARVIAQIGLDAIDLVGLDLSAASPWRETAFCAVPDATRDPRLVHHSVVTGPPHVRSYVGAPLLSAAGDVIGVICALDVSPRPVSSDRDIGRLAMLADLARDAWEALQTVARAEAAADAKAELLADVSHELRTPLNGIMGFTELLKRDEQIDGEALRTVERIDEAGRGLISIVDDALDLSKLTSGAVRLDVRPFSPSRLVEDAAAMIRPEAERKGLTLVADLPDAVVGPLLGDPDRLRQVLLNLLSNAVKFTGAGTVRVSLTADLGRDPAGPVPLTLAVVDSGVGIASDGIPRLFRRFAQADGSVAHRFGGTGLGLAISKTLLDAMGGTITVESSPGAGARFSVALSLPRVLDHRPIGSPSPVHRPVRREGLLGLAILLAEDAPLNQKLVLQMLAPFGVDVDVVPDGDAAVAAVTRRDYSLVLMDMEMPVVNGLEATRRIRALGGRAAAVPIVALTANVFPEQLDLCRAAGMDDCLTKPFTSDDLAAKALHWVRGGAPAGYEGQ